jgi:hypothetical protein
MNIRLSSTTGPALVVNEQTVSPAAVSQKMRDPPPRNEERAAPLAGTKRPRQDDVISECRGRSKVARLSSILIQRSNTTEAL